MPSTIGLVPWTQQDLNLRPSPCRGAALPGCAMSPNKRLCVSVGQRGLAVLTAGKQTASLGLVTCLRPRSKCILPLSTRDGSRTRMPLRTVDFESTVYTVPPLWLGYHFLYSLNATSKRLVRDTRVELARPFGH